jgi:hypothetical protein
MWFMNVSWVIINTASLGAAFMVCMAESTFFKALVLHQQKQRIVTEHMNEFGSYVLLSLIDAVPEARYFKKDVSEVKSNMAGVYITARESTAESVLLRQHRPGEDPPPNHDRTK